MSFISIFDVMGPNMIGPSSSPYSRSCPHWFFSPENDQWSTKRSKFTLYGSFASTFKGHGTDRALLGGIADFATDDMRIRNSLKLQKIMDLPFHLLQMNSKLTFIQIQLIFIWSITTVGK